MRPCCVYSVKVAKERTLFQHIPYVDQQEGFPFGALIFNIGGDVEQTTLPLPLFNQTVGEDCPSHTTGGDYLEPLFAHHFGSGELSFNNGRSFFNCNLLFDNRLNRWHHLGCGGTTNDG